MLGHRRGQTVRRHLARCVRRWRQLGNVLRRLAADLQRANKSLYYDKLSGTSMAAPPVAGAAALLIGADPSVTPERVRSALRSHGECVGGAFNTTTGRCPMRWTDDVDNAWEPLLSVGTLPWP